MGCSDSIEEKKNLTTKFDEREISNQAKVKPGENISISNNKLLIEKAESSICKIQIDNKEGNGFFCKFNYYNNMIYLMTCYHLISKEEIDFYDEIELKFNNNKTKKLNLKEKRNILYDDKLDFIAIEIKNTDEIKLNIFDIYDYCYNYEYDNINYNNRSIIIPYLGENNEIELSQGIINYSEKNYLYIIVKLFLEIQGLQLYLLIILKL